MQPRRPSPATIIASLALFFSLGGTAIAAHHYLITSTGQIKPSVLKKLTGNTGATGAAGATGLRGVEGPRGKEGPEGARSDVWQAGTGKAESTAPLSVSVPAGSYLVVAKTVAAGAASEVAVVACYVKGGGEEDRASGQIGETVKELTLTNVETTVLSTPGTIELECKGQADHFWDAKLTATKVGAIH
ncbi:MAG TPA: hypothetical protein VKG38_08965 [Solirubrobacteraceae bacterium]|nr:hypothetical protein [Solirubrobacteraceae bacterium]